MSDKVRVRELPSTYVIENGCNNFALNFDGNVLMFSTRAEAQAKCDSINMRSALEHIALITYSCTLQTGGLVERVQAIARGAVEQC